MLDSEALSVTIATEEPEYDVPYPIRKAVQITETEFRIHAPQGSTITQR